MDKNDIELPWGHSPALDVLLTAKVENKAKLADVLEALVVVVLDQHDEIQVLKEQLRAQSPR